MPPGPDGRDAPWRRTARDQLFDQRVVFLWGPLDDAHAGQLAAELMTLDATGDDPVHLHVDSPGGSLEAAFCVMDVIDLLGVEVTATCVGQAAGTAIGPLAVAHHRRATPHARFRLSEPVLAHTGTSTDLASWAASQHDQFRRFCERVAAAVGGAPEELARDLSSGRSLDADEARRYGLVDEICGPVARVYPMPGRPLGFRSRS
ncbi:MAG TPA: ATP-dependent Clp protease proteolytic subunit [Acidimicrobiales bacterium]|nr:ATP-dependent Clp protease proteolytic subunit [Acidimicrobiales bacterium]